MIQRIQSVFYLLAFVFFTLTAVFPVINKISQSNTESSVSEKLEMRVFGVNYERTSPDVYHERQDTLAIGSLTFAMAIFSLLLIFQYKNRQLQLKIGRFVVIIGSALCVMIAVYASRTSSLFQNQLVDTIYGVALFTPILGVIFAFMGNRFVQKDEDLVKSADRIR